jgi:hypothetical protein
MKQPDYNGYETAKRILIAKHPNHTPEQYHRAIRRIAKRYGV